MNINDLLPIGSVVLLKEGQKKLMIFGIKQSDEKDETNEFDYAGVMYPEGNMGLEYQFVFNHEDIAETVFRGFEDDERKAFITELTTVYQDIK